MIKFKNVTLKYDNQETFALKNLSLSIGDGEFVFIVGKTGAGKTSLFKLITREIKQDSGTIKVLNKDISYLPNNEIPYYRRNLGVVFQDFRLLDDRNVIKNVAFAQEIVGANRFLIKKRCIKALNLVGLRNKARKFPDELSGGERQKVAIARALINKPKLLLADEPTGNLDEISTNEVMDLLNRVNQTGTTVVVITHDIHMVSRMNKRVIRIKDGDVYSDTIGLDKELKEYMIKENEYKY